MKFKVGDRVQLRRDSYHLIENARIKSDTGTVVRLPKNSTLNMYVLRDGTKTPMRWATMHWSNLKTSPSKATVETVSDELRATETAYSDFDTFLLRSHAYPPWAFEKSDETSNAVVGSSVSTSAGDLACTISKKEVVVERFKRRVGDLSARFVQWVMGY